jgi:hypothetical protein
LSLIGAGIDRRSVGSSAGSAPAVLASVIFACFALEDLTAGVDAIVATLR